MNMTWAEIIIPRHHVTKKRRKTPSFTVPLMLVSTGSRSDTSQIANILKKG
jgi:hypothetical protein